MKRIAFLIYGVICHLMFLAVFVYMAGFVGNYLVPKSIDSAMRPPVGWDVATDLCLLALFALQHSGMARPAFKAIWTQIIPEPIERSTYVLCSNLAVIFLMWKWQPIDIVVWSASNTVVRGMLTALFVFGWLLVPIVTLMLNHFDLMGVRQFWLHLRGRQYTSLPFSTPLLYRYVRHPLYIGWALAFWCTPRMTVGHLLFAATMTVYMVLASKVEERDLVRHFGQRYRVYQQQTPAFVPRLPWRGVRLAQPSRPREEG